ncbi:MAG TPA: SDR family NAD(P)-dependent oxidoreductase, partial [Thermoanaerobaculia bacterium]|nr:SDR family NAD(P)-dependent oxidoreductase [Thermoanaerobaculia bacterium]
DFASSPFFVNDRLREWQTEGIPRRAGVSSLGMGGTNTHMVLEEAPALEPSGPSRPAQLLLLSARTATALDALTRDLAEHLKQHPGLPLADAAYTLHTGRKVMAHRRAVVCADLEEAVDALESRDPERVTDGFREAGARPVAFLFSGQGSQYAGMGRGLYESEPVFREEVDRCAELLRPHLGLDLREVILAEDEEEAAARLRQTALTQPALFVVEHALARLWMSWGVRPQAMLGHSIGEYVAACLAGVLPLEDALALVAERGRLMQSMPAGSMLAVPLPEPDVAPLLSMEIWLAAVNRPEVCVLSGTDEAIAALERELEGRGIEARRLHTSHAFHSAMMDPILPAFEAAVRKVTLRAPRLPYLSNVTGTWITAAEATDPGYWVRQLRGTVRFAAGVGELLADPDRVLLEVGPGNALATAARQHPARRPEQAVAVSMRHPKEPKDDLEVLLAAVGRLWLAGVEVDGDAFWAGQRRRRVPLPTYPFERKRFWVDPKKPSFEKTARSSADLADWFYVPFWKQSQALFARDKVRELGFARGERWLVLLDNQGFGERLLQRLGRAGADVIAVRAGAGTEDPTGVHLQVDPGNDEETTRFFANLREQGWMPSRIVYLWALDSNGPNPRSMDLCLHGLLSVARGLGRPLGEPEQGDLTVFLALTSGAQNITGEEPPSMERAVLTGACKAIPREYSNLYCRSLDIPAPAALKPELQLDLVERVLAEALTAPGDPAATVAGLRGPHRWVQAFQPVRLDEGAGTPRLREGGIYLITGGMGGIGLTVAEHLARKYRAKLMLSGRTPLPPRPEWEGYLASCAPDDRVGRRLRKLLELKALGAEVMVVTGDAADPQNLRAIRDRAMARFGRIDGIFHAAGLPGGGLIHTRDRRAALSVLGPKIDGTMAVMDTFTDVQPQFLVLFSSVTSLLSQPGQADYAAGNAFLDAFAQATMAGPVFTVSINWDAWQEVGMAVETEVPAELRAWREESLRQGVSPAQGIEALERILRASLPQVAVSRSDFQARVEESHAWKTFQALEESGEESREVHARPALGSVYVAPRDETERRIAEIWQEVLGIDRVGIHDNFFDLGGNSLVGLKVVSRLKRELAADVSAVTLFEGPTVASLAQLLAGAGEEGEDGEPVYADRKSRGALRREKLRRRKS